MRNPSLLAVLACVAVLSGCDGGQPPAGGGGGNGAGGGNGLSPPLTPDYWTKGATASLVSFSGSACPAAEKYVDDVMVAQMRKQLEQTRRWLHLYGTGYYYGYGGDGGSGGGSGTGGGSAAGGSGGSGGSAGGPNDYTTTNNQVAGVDEPDVMKNDGTRLFVLANQRLYTAKSWPPEQLATVGSVALSSEQWSDQMFLEGNHVAVLGTRYDSSSGGISTLVTMVDVSDLAAPKVTGRYEVPGYYLSARMIGSTVRLVTSWGLQQPPDVQDWYWPSQPNETTAQIDAEIDALILRNEALIRGRTLTQWLGGSTWVDSTGNARYYPIDCANLAHSSVPVQPGATNVFTFDLEDQSVFDRQALLENTDLIYSSGDALYLVSRNWWWWWYSYEDEGSSGVWDGNSVVHKFDLGSPDKATYLASGTVSGFPLDQFSLDEYQGFLRVAMQGPGWSGARIEVLAQAGSKLILAGETPPVANGEALESVRFVGPRGYLSTFHYVYQIDPLFTVDLSNPLEPAVVGQLTVPGYSTYLHPIDDTHLLSVGEWVPETPGDWTGRHLQLSLFDVSDLKNPALVATQALGSYPAEADGWTYGWGWSAALWDHHAFNYFPAKGLLAVPFYWWQEHGSADPYGYQSWTYREGSEVDVYKVDPATGFTELGAVNLTDLPSPSNNWWVDSYARRSVMADDYVYAVGAGGVRVARSDAPGTVLATARFAP